MADLYQPSGAEELSRRFLRDIRLASIQAGNDDIPVGYGSDFWLTSQGIANICLLGFRNISLSEADQNVLTAEGEALDAIRQGYALPEVSASKAGGKLVIKVSGSTTISDGQAFIYPNGKTGKFIGAYVNPANLSEVLVECTSTGSAGNLRAGEVVRLIGPPVNVATEATVSANSPITGGTDAEDDARKRIRILNTLRYKPSGGNWSYIRQECLNFSGGIQNCFVYPALGGPSSVKVCPVKDFDIANFDYSRSVPDSLLAEVRSHLQSLLPVGVQVIVQAVASQYTDVALKIKIPSSSKSGGNGRGWTDVIPWPSLVPADNGRVSLSDPGATYDIITLSANTTVAPIDGQTHISWWSSIERKFYHALVVGHSGSSGSWTISLDRPLVDKTGAGPVSGDFVSPSCQYINGYGDAYIELFRSLGSGENTAQAARLPRALRRPGPSDESPYDLTNSSFKAITQKYNEITDLSIGYASSTTPVVPSDTVSAPNILIPRKFGVYPS